MNSIDFKTNGTDMINYITTYMDTLPFRRVTPIVEPGYMRKLLQEYAPKQGESFKDILKDVDEVIMPGVSQSELPLPNLWNQTSDVHRGSTLIT